jgi:gas vesicle protein
VGTTEDQLRRQADDQRERMGETLDAIGDRLSPERMIQRRKAAVGQRARRVKDTVMGSPGYVEPVARRMREQAHDATQAVQHTPEMIAEQTRGNPIAAGLIAFGGGLLLATLMPKSETEQRLVQQAQPQLQQATEQLKEAGREIASDAKEHMQEAATQVKSTGSEAADAVRDQARSSAEEVKANAGE